MNRNKTDVREIATLASAEAAHCRHDLARPAHLLTAFFIWDERVSGPYRDAAGIKARDLRKAVKRRIPAAKKKPGPVVDLSREVQEMVEEATSPATLLAKLLSAEGLAELLVEAGGDPSAMTVVAIEAYPTCPKCSEPISEGVRSRLVRVPVGKSIRVLAAWSCARCGNLLGLSPPESGKQGVL